MDLIPPSEHHVLVFLCGFLALLMGARLLGALAQRAGQPSVVGELAAGLLLGPSVLGRVAPDVEAWLFPPDEVQTGMLFTVAWIGVIFLLLAAGTEVDLGLIRRLGRAAGVVSTGSLLVPIAGGLLVGALMPGQFLGTEDRTSFALFLGAALSISSLPVIAKILTDMGYMRRNVGQLTLAAGMANDVVGWVVLGVIAGLAGAEAVSVAEVGFSVAGVAAFFAIAFVLGQRGIDQVFRWFRRHEVNHSDRTSVVVLITLVGAAATQWLGVEAVLGAFVIGILIGRSPYHDLQALHTVETASTAFLAPVFFATAGLRVDLGLLSDSTVALWAVGVIVVASLTKFVGALAGSALVRLPLREGAALGVALNARGALEIVIASVGLTLGVLNSASYTVVVLMAMATSLMAPPLLRAVLGGWPGTSEEQDRLREEARLSSNLVVRGERVLLPNSGGLESLLAAHVFDLAWPPGTPATLLAAEHEDQTDLEPAGRVLDQRDQSFEVRPGAELVDAITDEAKLGYGAVILGIDSADEDVLPRDIEDVVAVATIPVVLVRPSTRAFLPRAPWVFGRVLVPVAGGQAASAGQEIAFGIGSSVGSETVVAHVTSPTRGRYNGNGSQLARNILTQASEKAISTGARVQTIERSSPAPANEILRLANEIAADAVVVGATRKTVADQPFLGNIATEVLLHCNSTVIAIVMPENQASGHP